MALDGGPAGRGGGLPSLDEQLVARRRERGTDEIDITSLERARRPGQA